MKYQDISLEEFIALTQTHKVVIFVPTGNAATVISGNETRSYSIAHG